MDHLLSLIPFDNSLSFLIYLLELAGAFLVFTFVTYWTHRIAHCWKPLWYLHEAHHSVPYKGEYEFSLLNLVGWYNDWRSTLDVWVTEVLPMAGLVLLWPATWPLAVLFYIDNVLSEGLTDHNPRINIPGLAMGKYHIEHHKDMSVNFDGYFRLWDKVFGTQRNVV
ncbi:sterol desaturase family protein [Kiloniella sp. b19]|uniref:sterol desaturase family protein n=1 Tax=Kiloniella sp. GXU_MW_B19 TaxID=3141326 RepID=UPI0031E444A3